MNIYLSGEQVRVGNHRKMPNETQESADLRLPFRTVDGTDVDPATVTLVIRKPNGERLTFLWTNGPFDTLTRDVIGRFYAEPIVDVPGRWFYSIAGTGTPTVAAKGEFKVATLDTE
jgi:hypothetical protein